MGALIIIIIIIIIIRCSVQPRFLPRSKILPLIIMMLLGRLRFRDYLFVYWSFLT